MTSLVVATVTFSPSFAISSSMRHYPPRRIVCLTEETVETLYLLGKQDRIVGVSGYAVRPPQVRREKPRVSAFISADLPKILALEPDLVLTFSDLQADIAANLMRAGVAVHAFNQRDIAGILAMIRTLGALVDAAGRAEQLARQYEQRLAEIAATVTPAAKPFAASTRTTRPSRLPGALAGSSPLSFITVPLTSLRHCGTLRTHEFRAPQGALPRGFRQRRLVGCFRRSGQAGRAFSKATRPPGS